jgi:hypothetical protein
MRISNRISKPIITCEYLVSEDKIPGELFGKKISKKSPQF